MDRRGLYKKRRVSDLQTSFEKLDELTGGIQPHSLNVIAAPPSMGKTALAMNIAEHVAIEQAKPVALFSLEISSQQLVPRLLCSRAKANLQSIRHGFFGKGDNQKLFKAAADYLQSKLFIDDRTLPTITVLEDRVKALTENHEIGLIVIDTFESLGAPWRLPPSERKAETSVIAKGLKALARELEIPILVTATVNHESMELMSGSTMVNLDEIDELEREADVIYFLYRPAYYANDVEEKVENCDKAELIIARNRQGHFGRIPLTFLSEYTRFESRSSDAAV